MKKSLLSFILAVITLAQAAAYDFQVDGIYYNKNGYYATVTYQSFGAMNYSGEVYIPYSVYYGAHYTVTAIGYCAFLYCRDLTAVSLPYTLTSIGQSAFYGCEGLTKVQIPNSVKTMETMAFEACYKLSTVNIPTSLTSISEYAFMNCDSLKEIDIPNTIIAIKEGAFRNSGLRDVIIPNSVKTIEDEVFDWCSFLAKVAIGNSVTSIGYHAFYDCSNLRSITCLAVTPPAIETDCFMTRFKPKNQVYESATLYVPKESLQAYRNAPEWSRFENIKAIGSSDDTGDVNGDGIVNITDLNSIINVILQGNSATEDGMDLNGDGVVNISDINILIGIILKS